MPLDNSLILEVAKKYKECALECCDSGDLPPVAIVEQNGELLVGVIAPKVDRDHGLHACQLLQQGFDPDVLFLVVDCHMASVEAKDGDVRGAEEIMEEKFPPGSMMRMAEEEWPIRAGLIAACLCINRVTRDGEVSLTTLPYSYFGKGKTPFRWVETDITTMANAKDGIGELGGNVPRALKEIMATPPMLENKEVKDFMATGTPMTKEQAMRGTMRACLSVLKAQGYSVMKY